MEPFDNFYSIVENLYTHPFAHATNPETGGKSKEKYYLLAYKEGEFEDSQDQALLAVLKPKGRRFSYEDELIISWRTVFKQKGEVFLKVKNPFRYSPAHAKIYLDDFKAQ